MTSPIETNNVVGRLDEFDKDEWRDVTRKVQPDCTDEQFEEAWARFQDEKRRRVSQ